MAITITAGVQRLLDAFATQTGGTNTAHYQKVYSAVTSSQEQIQALDTHITDGTITAIQYGNDGHGGGSGGSLAGTAIRLSASFLDNSTARDLTYVVGHEVQHAANAKSLAATDASQWTSVTSSIQNFNNATPTGTQNLTSAVQAYSVAHLNDEGSATLAGWNSIVSAAIAQKGGVALTADEYKALQYTTGYANNFFDSQGNFKPGFTLNSTGRFDLVSSNITTSANILGVQHPSVSSDQGVTYLQYYQSTFIKSFAQ